MYLEVACLPEERDAEKGRNFGDEVRRYVCHEEGKEKPAGGIAVELAGFP